jgi:uncharacterized membrane protein
MLYALLHFLHVLAVVVWVGGMFFAHVALRPALVELPGAQRLPLMHGVLRRFLAWAGGAALLTLGTGLWMMGRTAKQVVQSGGSFQMPLAWTLMAALGVLMLLIYGHIRFALFKRFERAMAGGTPEAAAQALASLRQWMLVNLLLGITVIAVALLRF